VAPVWQLIGGFNPVTPVRLLDTRPTAKVGAGCVVSIDVSAVAPAAPLVSP
jgi:hypothetical protein